MTRQTFPLFVAVLAIGLAGGYCIAPRTPAAPRKDAASAQEPAPAGPALDELSRRFVAISAAIRPAVVHIKVGSSQASGSGVIVAADGRVLTNHHVVRQGGPIEVQLDAGRRLSARVLGSDPYTDIAVLQLEGAERLPVAPLGDADALRIGQWVLAFGNPFGIGQTVTAGIVSARGRAGIGISEAEDFIQTDAAINPGNSGGPLVDMQGRVVGINSAIISRTGGSQGVGLAIPINIARSIMDSLARTGKIYTGYLGVVPETVEFTSGPLQGRKAVRVTQVIADSPAEQAGVSAGDIILSYDGQPIGGRRHLLGRIRQGRPGQTVALELVRGQARKTLHIVVGQRAVR